MLAQATLAVLLLSTAAVHAAEGNVEFTKDKFKMICPEDGTWFKKNAELKPPGVTHTETYSRKTKGLYHCKYKDIEGNIKRYYFFVKGKACANCYEMEPEYLALAIVADVVGTTCVMMMVFSCTKKKRSAAYKARPGGRPAPARPPPALSPSNPSPYQALNPLTRSNDVYSKTG
ncbi:uncharacterized protein AB9W97_008690 [Spinachia spinachia]